MFKALFFFHLTGLVLWGATEPTYAENPQITVSVFDDAQVPADIMTRAQRRATEIFSHAGMGVTWVSCSPANTSRDAAACTETLDPNHLVLSVIRHAANSTDSAAFGVAFLAADGTGRYGDVFWKRAQEFQENSNVDVATILGCVMAHEIGHLLLGSNAHAVSGIMRAHWEASDLRRINMGDLLFLPEQEKRMRARVVQP